MLFLLLYRLGEAQLVKIVPMFLLDRRRRADSPCRHNQSARFTEQWASIAFMCGALLGGFVVARHGLKFWLWPMLLAIHLPDAVFIWLAYAQPANLFAIGAGVAVEQFGYGFGFMAFMLYMIYIARGEHATAHYAICTGFMALGMMLPGMWSGWLQQQLGYPHFFVWVILATIPSFIVALFIPLDAEFGKRNGTAVTVTSDSATLRSIVLVTVTEKNCLNAPDCPESKLTMKSIRFNCLCRALLLPALLLEFSANAQSLVISNTAPPPFRAAPASSWWLPTDSATAI